MNFYRGLKLMVELVRIWLGLYFRRGCGLLDGQHRRAGSPPVSIEVCPVPQGAEHGSERVNPAKMKLCPGFHNTFASKQTTCSVAVCILVPRKGQFCNFRKSQPLESCALWCRKLRKLYRSISSWCRHPQKAPACSILLVRRGWCWHNIAWNPLVCKVSCFHFNPKFFVSKRINIWLDTKAYWFIRLL